MAELIPISVVIADRSYRIRIEPQNEEIVRKTIKAINDKIIEFKTQFAGKDMQDYISMVLMWYASEQNSGGAASINTSTFTEKLETIEKMLDGQLS
jgi:hypothetical protein